MMSNSAEAGMNLAAEELCPVAESLLGQLYRSSPEGVAVLLHTAPPRARGALGVSWFPRAQLGGLGLAIALTCSEDDLSIVGGRAGSTLLERAKAAGSTPVIQIASRKRVTLADFRTAKDQLSES